MPATLRLREESDGTAELQDLLSRLQTYQVDGEFGGLLDNIRRGAKKAANEIKELWPDRAKVLKKCGYLLDTLKDKKACAGDIEVPLQAFIEQMKKIQDKDENTDNENMTQLAYKCQVLYRSFIVYRLASYEHTPDRERPKDARTNELVPRIPVENSKPVNDAREKLTFVMRQYVARFGQKVTVKFFYNQLPKRYYEHW
jgi:hypothetical protein